MIIVFAAWSTLLAVQNAERSIAYVPFGAETFTAVTRDSILKYKIYPKPSVVYAVHYALSKYAMPRKASLHGMNNSRIRLAYQAESTFWFVDNEGNFESQNSFGKLPSVTMRWLDRKLWSYSTYTGTLSIPPVK